MEFLVRAFFELLALSFLVHFSLRNLRQICKEKYKLQNRVLTWGPGVLDPCCLLEDLVPSKGPGTLSATRQDSISYSATTQHPLTTIHSNTNFGPCPTPFSLCALYLYISFYLVLFLGISLSNFPSKGQLNCACDMSLSLSFSAFLCFSPSLIFPPSICICICLFLSRFSSYI